MRRHEILLKARDEDSTRVAVDCGLPMLEEVEPMNGTGRHRQASYSSSPIRARVL
jgi:hypothetical protein